MEGVILNADLGEGESPVLSTKFIQTIGAANIACGGHAGNDDSIRHCLEACLANNTLPGAHPGIAANFGRGSTLPTAEEFSRLLESQWQRITSIASDLGTSLHHIKLHGSLYMAVEHSEELAETYLNFLQHLTPTPVIFSLAAGAFLKKAEGAGLTVWGELFGDRQYESDATLRSRSHSGALIHDTNTIEARVSHWINHGEILSVDDTPIKLAAKTICLHSDTPNALLTAKYLAKRLAGVRE